MATIKITEKPSVDQVKNDASVLLTQLENVGGAEKEALRRVPLSAFIAALRTYGVNQGYQTTAEIDAMKDELVKTVESTNEGIRITFWNDDTTDIPIKSGGLSFDEIFYDQTDGMLHIRMEGEDVVDPCFIGGGGGGGGSGTGATIRIVNRMGGRSLTVMSTADSYPVNYTWTSIDTETSEATGSGNASWYVDNRRVAFQSNIAQGDQSFDILPFLTNGVSNTVKLTIEDAYGGTKSFTWTITVTNVTLTWNVSGITVYNDSPLALKLTPTGAGEKTVNVWLDGVLFKTTTTSASGRAVTVTIPAQPHGAHVITAQMSLTIDGEIITTPMLSHTGIWTQAGYGKPIIALESKQLTAKQFETVGIRHMVFTPGSEQSVVTYMVNGEAQPQATVNREVRTWAYRPTNIGTDTLTITSGSTTETITLTVEAIGYDIAEVEGASVIIDPTGHSNNESGAATFGYKDSSGVNHPFAYSANFDWVNGGFQQDADGVTAFVIKRGTSVTLDRSLFGDNAKNTGKELKVIFRAENVRNYDTVLMDGTSGGVGLKLQAQQAVLSSLLEEKTAQYCEGKKIELDVNIEPTSGENHHLASVWLRGIPSRIFPYTGDDSWQQDNPTGVVIGSADADVWLYKLKLYETSLTRHEILANYIADCADTEEMIARYRRNDIYSDDGTVNPQALAAANTTLRVLSITALRMTTSKSDKVRATVQMTLASGGATHNFTATNVIVKAQGTSSLDYIDAALNFDLDFSEAVWQDADGNTMNAYAMTVNSIPVNYLNIKLNVASSENANNVVLVDEYNTYNPYVCEAKQNDPRVRDTVEGHPCAVFFTNSSDATIQVSSHTVEAGQTIFYGIGDMNNSKKNTAVFGQTGAHPLQMCIEILNNNNPQCRFKSDDLTNETWGDKDDDSFEFRYPDGGTAEMKEEFQKMLSWVVSTDTTAATDGTLDSPVTYGETTYTEDSAEYRAAKFKAEVADWFVVDSLTWHYLFTERHCCPDNRAKNVFVSYEWVPALNAYRWNFRCHYDCDTGEGNDNSGGLTFTYGLEDTDEIGGAKVFNASDSVLWCNVRDHLADELVDMYKDRESAGAWDSKRILAKFKTYQAARPEALYAEDAWTKYVASYLKTGETRYLDMAHGTKEDQREQFETYEDRYEASKYGGSLATSDSIELRASTQITDWAGVEPNGDMTITPYSDMYIAVKYGNAGTVKVRAKRGVPTLITCPTDNLDDTETYIYLASNISEIAGLSSLYTRVAALSAATRLQRLELGSGETGYSNGRLTTISFGNNELLEYIDLRGTPRLTQALDLQGLESIAELYVSPSGITGVTFAEGAPLTNALIPAVQSLTARRLTEIESFAIDASALVRLWIEDCEGLNTLAIVQTATGLTRGRITGVNWTMNSADLLMRLAALPGISSTGENTDTFVLTGSAYIEAASQGELSTLAATFPNLTVTYGSILPSYTVTFKVNGEVVDTQTVRSGGAAIDPVRSGKIPTPSKDPTSDTVYTYIGWDTPFTTVITDIETNAVFRESTRTYTVKYWHGVTLLETHTVEAGGAAPYEGAELESTATSLWVGWDGNANSVYSDLDLHASFITPTLPSVAATGYDYLYSDDPNDNSAYTLAEFYGAIMAGQAKTFFTKGDRIKIVPNTNVFMDTEIIMRLDGFNHFKLADGSGEFASCVFGMIGVMNATRQMNSTNTNVGGFGATAMYTWLNTTLYNALPQQWKAMMKQVNVLSSAGNTSAEILTTACKVFLYSYAEVGFAANEVPYKNEVDPEAEEKTFTTFTDNASRIKKTYNGDGSAQYWWLRSPWASTSTGFAYVSNYGSGDNTGATNSYFVSFGFCI